MTDKYDNPWVQIEALEMEVERLKKQVDQMQDIIIDREAKRIMQLDDAYPEVGMGMSRATAVKQAKRNMAAAIRGTDND